MFLVGTRTLFVRGHAYALDRRQRAVDPDPAQRHLRLVPVGLVEQRQSLGKPLLLPPERGFEVEEPPLREQLGLDSGSFGPKLPRPDERLDLIIRGGKRVYGEGTKVVRYPITSDVLL